MRGPRQRKRTDGRTGRFSRRYPCLARSELPTGCTWPGQIPWGSRRVPLEPDTKLWLERMAERGWTVPTWPREYGGAELNREQYSVLIEELKRSNARPPLTGRGVNYIGPTLLELGSDDQKARWLPGIARGEGGWAMGYSEPGAGSDLASLNTRATLDGDHYVINGRKTWTSDAMDCDYIFVLVRTSRASQTRRYQPAAGGHASARRDGAPDPAAVRCLTVQRNPVRKRCARRYDVIGGVNNGWTVGKRLLQFERSTHAGINISGSQGGRTEESRMPQSSRATCALGRGLLRDPICATASSVTRCADTRNGSPSDVPSTN